MLIPHHQKSEEHPKCQVRSSSNRAYLDIPLIFTPSTPAGETNSKEGTKVGRSTLAVVITTKAIPSWSPNLSNSQTNKSRITPM
ncbi:hypothetical protein Scep_000013 [Stephania cephalantha]|uniref:Uncharacterized protein n=1 Tax=Stephania cephalantha TaxID=152367 RepID=A0AAP0L6R6_9MAGN